MNKEEFEKKHPNAKSDMMIEEAIASAELAEKKEIKKPNNKIKWEYHY